MIARNLGRPSHGLLREHQCFYHLFSAFLLPSFCCGKTNCDLLQMHIKLQIRIHLCVMTDDAVILLYQTIMSDVTVICQCYV